MANRTRQPHSAEARAREWLNQRGLPTNSHLKALAGDASDRRFVRVIPPNGPTCVLVVHDDEIDPVELPLIQVADLFKRIQVPVPEIRSVEAALGIVELEDLGDTTLEAATGNMTDAERHACYEEAVELIVAIQRGGRYYETTKHSVFSISLDVNKLYSELDFFVKYFIDGYRQCTLSAATQRCLDTEFRMLATEIADEPRVLCHRDFHSRNLMRHQTRLYIIDFQDARMGPDTYDLASLLRDSYVKLTPETMQSLIEHYIRLLNIEDTSGVRLRFVRTALHRNLKALGTFGHQISAKKKCRYSDSIPRTLGYVRQTLCTDSRYSRLQDVLSSLIPELRS